MDDIFESDVDEVKSLSDLHEEGLDGLDDNLFVDSGGNGDSESNRVEEEFGDEVIEMNTKIWAVVGLPLAQDEVPGGLFCLSLGFVSVVVSSIDPRR
ncbi:hypothetical protein ACOSQ3_013877 [Xanthoceras sorbifolium]